MPGVIWPLPVVNRDSSWWLLAHREERAVGQPATLPAFHQGLCQADIDDLEPPFLRPVEGLEEPAGGGLRGADRMVDRGPATCGHVLDLGPRLFLKCRQGQFGTQAHAGDNVMRTTFTVACCADRHCGDCYGRHTGTVALPAGSASTGAMPDHPAPHAGVLNGGRGSESSSECLNDVGSPWRGEREQRIAFMMLRR